MDNTGTPRDSRGKIFSGESVTLLIHDEVKPYRNRKKKKWLKQTMKNLGEV